MRAAARAVEDGLPACPEAPHEATLAAMRVLDGGILGAWAVQLFYIVLLSLGLYVRWKRGKWMSIRLIETAPAAH